jgi:hypothetical protein
MIKEQRDKKKVPQDLVCKSVLNINILADVVSLKSILHMGNRELRKQVTMILLVLFCAQHAIEYDKGGGVQTEVHRQTSWVARWNSLLAEGRVPGPSRCIFQGLKRGQNVSVCPFSCPIQV